MIQRIFHGKITPDEVARALLAEFNRGNYSTQQLGQGKQVVVQIATRQHRRSGGATALSVTLQQHKDGVAVMVGQQSWAGLAASLGKSAFLALRNPFHLLGRIEDIAHDIESLQLSERVWQVIEQYAKAAGATQELSERLRRMTCEYCGVANEVGEGRCIACGAPLGRVQPRTCLNCGFVVRSNEVNCPNCKAALPVLAH
jgi:predicted Zn-ribbon and HTH transcriptional regulator